MKNLLFIAFCFLSLQAFGQNDSDVKPIVERFINSTVQGNYQDVMDITYPKVFDFFPKDEILKAMQGMLQNDDFSITFNSIDPMVTTEPVKEIDGAAYILVHYRNSLNMKFHNMEIDDPGLFRSYLMQSYPDAHIAFDDNTNTFKIEMPSRLLGIKDERTAGEWRFINFNQTDKQMLQLILDEKIIQEFGL